MPRPHRTLIMMAIAGLFGLADIVAAPDAEAGRGGTRYRQWEFDTRRPIRGVEGFYGLPGQYCSYRREPERKCWPTSNGGERCKVVSWRLIQKCY